MSVTTSDLLKKLNERKQQRLRSSIDYGLKYDPEASAKEQSAANRLNLPLDVVERNSDQVFSAQHSKEILDKLRATKHLRTQFQNPEFARIAHDDVNELADVEDAASGLRRTAEAIGAGATLATLGIGESIWRTPEAIGRVLDGINQATGITALSQWLVDKGWDPFVEPNTQVGRGWQFVLGDLTNSTEIADRVGESSEILTKTFEPFRRITEKGQQADLALSEALGGDFEELGDVVTDPEAWAGFIGQAAPSLYAAYKSGGSIPFLAWLESMETANDAAEFEERTGTQIEPAAFLQASAQVALINSYLERSGLYKVFNKAFGQAGSNTFSGFVRGALAEAGTEAAQQFNANVAALVAFDPDRKLSQGVLAGFMGGFGTGGPAGALSAMGRASGPDSAFANDLQRAEKAIRAQELLDATVEAATNAKLTKRAPEAMRDYLTNVVGAENMVYLSPEDAEGFFQSHPEVLDNMPNESAKAIAEALSSGSEVAITVADYVTHLIDHHAEIRDLIRNDIDGMNASEAQQWLETGREEFEEDAGRILEEMDRDNEFRESADRVAASIQDQLVQAGTPPEIAARYAALHKAFAVVTAEKMGITPEQVYEKFGLQVQRRDVVPEELQEAFNQTATEVGLHAAVKMKDGRVFFGGPGEGHIMVMGRAIEEGYDYKDVDEDGFVDRREGGANKFFNRKEALAEVEKEFRVKSGVEGWLLSEDELHQSPLAEYLQARAKGLDMSKEARMERAREMGFDTETVYYHGTVRDFAEFMEPDIEAGRQGRTYGGELMGGFAFSTSPEIASGYAADIREAEEGGGNVQPVLLKTERPLVIDAAGKNWQQYMMQVREARLDDQYDSVVLKNVDDQFQETGEGITADTVIVFDPSQIRSINAAFDPDFETSADLLAQGPIQTYSITGIKSNGSEFKVSGLRLIRGEVGGEEGVVFAKGSGENRQNYKVSPEGNVLLTTAKAPKTRKMAQDAVIEPEQPLAQGPSQTRWNDYKAEQEARPIKDQISEPIRRKDGTYRVNAQGDITGAPIGVKTEEDIQEIVSSNVAHIEDPLAQMPSSAEWYEVSGQAIRDVTNGDPELAERMVRMMAVLSADNAVGSNTTGAIKAIYQMARGETAAAGRFPNKMREISQQIMEAEDMNLDVPGVNSKVMSFYRNLWDATFQSDKYENAATMDVWMARLYGYQTDTFGAAQYRFANLVTQRITEQYNQQHGTDLKPRQIQAALWVYSRNRERYGDRLSADVALEDRSAFDTYINRAKQHITVEAVPSVDSGLFPEIHQASPEQRAEYTRRAMQLLLNEEGGNELFKQLDIPLYQVQDSEGTFEGAVNPNAVLSIVTEKVGGKPNTTRADMAAKALQYIYTQDAVPWFQLDPTLTGATRGVAVRFSDQPSFEAEEAFLEHLQTTQQLDADFTRIGNDFVLINFTNLSNAKFRRAVVEAADSYSGPGAELITGIGTDVKAKGNYLEQDWSNEQEAVAEIEGYFREAGRPDLLPWLRDRREAVGRLQADFRDERFSGTYYQGSIPAVAERASREAGTRRLQEAGFLRSDGQVPLTHFGRVGGLTQLDPAQFGTAAAGAERARAGEDFLPRTYYYLPGTKPESTVRTRSRNRYFTTVLPEEIYDFRNAREDFGDLSLNQLEQAVRDAGYKGYWVKDYGAVAMFEPLEARDVTDTPMQDPKQVGWDARGTTEESEAFYQRPVPTDPSQIISPLNLNASQQAKAEQLHQLGLENEKIVKPVLNQIDKRFRSKSSTNHKDIENIVRKANRPSVKEKKPWHDVEHIRDGFRFKTVVKSYDDIVEMIQMMMDSGAQVIKAETGTVINPKQWGFRPAAFDLRMPNGQLVEWYLVLDEVEAYKKKEGHALFEKWRNRDLGKLTPAEHESYMDDVLKSYEEYATAFDAALERVGGQDRESIESAWAASLARAEALASSYTGLNVAVSEPVSGTDLQEPLTRMAETPGAVRMTSPSSSSNIMGFTDFTSTPSIPQFRAFDRYEQQQRGMIQFTEEGGLITLLENADLSTFLHESGHFFFEAYKVLARENDAIRADIDVLLDFVGVESLEQWEQMSIEERRAGHEKVAEAFERYLFEGKAPSLELQSLFDRFRSWLLEVYKNLRNLNTPLTDEVRQVFDRMLANETQIENRQVANNYTALFESEEESGMTPAEWQRYQSLNEMRREASQSALDKRSLRDMQWLSNARSRLLREMQADHKAKRKDMRADVAEEVRKEPVYHSMQFLRTGEATDPEGNQIQIDDHKMNREQFRERYPDVSLNQVRGMTDAEGVDIDVLAENLGWTSGDEMVQSILKAEPINERIDRVTDQRMLQTYGDLTNPEKMEEAVMEALHSEAHTRFLHTELTHLTKQAGVGNVLSRAAKAFAKQAIERKKVKDIKPHQYSQAEARAGRLAERAIKKGEREEAAQHKRAQVLNAHFFKAANNAKGDIEKAIRYFKKFNREGTRKNLDPDYLDQIDKLLEAYDFRQVTQKEIDRRKALSEWVAEQEAMGLSPAIDERLLRDAKRQHYRETPVEELMGLYDSVKNIEHLGRLKHKLIKQQEQRDLDRVATMIRDSVNDNAPKRNKNKIEHNSFMDRVQRGIEEGLAMHRKFASMARQMDGDRVGPVWQYLIRPMNDAGNMEAVEREKATMRMTEIFEPLKKMNLRQKVFIPEINNSISLEGRIMIALNQGNELNKRRVMTGDGWTEQQVDAILDTLTEDQWNFVQDVWDFIDSYWPQIAEKEKRVTGVVPEKVESTPVNTKFGELRGGYFPIMYDSERSFISQSFDEAEIAKQMMQGSFARATTRRGHTKERFKGDINRPIRKDFGGIFQHVDQVIHDLSWHEWLVDTQRLLNHPAVANAITERYGMPVLKMFKKTMTDIAAGDIPAQNMFETAINHLRQGTTIAGMGWSLWTSALQPLGLSQSIVRIGPKYVGRGIADWFGNASKMESTAKKIFEKSDFMRLRGKTLQREISEIRNTVSTGGRLPMIQNTYFYFIMKLQQVADFPTWLGEYHKAIDQGNDESTAVARADQAVIDSQSGGQIKDLAQIQRGGPLLKLWTNFYSYFNVTFNLTAESAARVKRPKDIGRFMVDMALLYTIPATISAIMRDVLMGDCDGDEDCVTEAIVRENLSYMLGTVVGVRELSGVAAGFYGYSGPPGTRFFSEMSKLGAQIEQGEADAAFWRAANQSAGILFHYPATQVHRTASGFAAIIEGDVEGVEAVKAPLFGPPR